MTIVEALIIVTAIAYSFTGQLWVLLAWEAAACIYLAVGLAIAWRGSREEPEPPRLVRSQLRWGWVFPLMSSVVGANAAVMGLIASQSSGGQSTGRTQLAVASAVGIVASWNLLHAGFAQIYQAIDTRSGAPGIEFPRSSPAVFLDYLYFSFTIGSSFATSDANVTVVRVRRVVLVHSVASFFYNALVVAVAFQLLQGLATS